MKKLRIFVFFIAAVCFALLFLRSASDLPKFGEYKGPYGDIINARVESERHTPQSVAAITFDYRGFDTLCEEFIFLPQSRACCF